MKRNDLIIENEKLKTRCERGEQLILLAMQENTGLDLTLQSQRSYITLLMALNSIDKIEIPKEKFEEILNTKQVVFTPIKDDAGKMIGTRLELKDVEITEVQKPENSN